MKKFQDVTFAIIGKSRLLVLILFFSSSASLFAVNDLSVSGVTGGSAAANGTYVYQGTHNSHYYWKSSNNNWYIYWHNYWGDWEINPVLDYTGTYYANTYTPTASDGIPYATPGVFVWDAANYDFTNMTMEQVTPTPVELTTFAAYVKNGFIELNWQTATEVNNYGFEIERSQNNTWQKIAFIQGHGNSNSPKEYSFTDKPNGGSNFKYRLKQIDTDGKYEYSPEVEVNINVPTDFSVKQNFPNPFNPTTKIEFAIPTDNHVQIKVFNVLGMELATLLNEHRQAGTHSVEFDASNLSSGIYFYKIVSGEYSEMRKMILLR